MMKSTGIVRKVDELGRIVIPIEIRRTLDINLKDEMEIFVDNEKIVLSKYKSNMTCNITGEISEDNLSLANGKIVLNPKIAQELIKEIQSQINQEQ